MTIHLFWSRICLGLLIPLLSTTSVTWRSNLFLTARERTQWRLYQKFVVCTMLYVFVPITGSISSVVNFKSSRFSFAHQSIFRRWHCVLDMFIMENNSFPNNVIITKANVYLHQVYVAFANYWIFYLVPLGFFKLRLINLALKSFDFMRIWWWLLQKRVGRAYVDIYVFLISHYINKFTVLVKYVPNNYHETGYVYPTRKSKAIIGNKIPGPKIKSYCSSFKLPVFLFYDLSLHIWQELHDGCQ